MIGKQGEHVFVQWALDHHLSANKAEIDIGVNFFCQVMSPVINSGSVESAGPMLAAQVKTVEGEDKPRLRINRIDAADLLRQTQATCLFGVRLSDKSIHFQFLTKEFVDQLLSFLKTNRNELSISHASMSDDLELFRKQLRRYTNPFEQLQLRIHLIKRRLVTAIPGADFVVQSTEEDTVCHFYVPCEADAFIVEPSAREEVRNQIFRGGSIDPRDDRVDFHPLILDALEETQSSALHLIHERPAKVLVSVRWKDSQATEQFEMHVFEDEVSFVHRAGLRLTITSKTKKTKNGTLHATESKIFVPCAGCHSAAAI